MTDRLKSVLSRVLSEELGKQVLWELQDTKAGLPEQHRTELRLEIRDFMDANDIKFNHDIYLNTMV